MRRQPRILILEDSETQAMRLRLLFEQEGWQTRCELTVGAVQAAVEEYRPDLIVADEYLAGRHSQEFLGATADGRRDGRHSVLLLTGEQPSVEPAFVGFEHQMVKGSGPDVVVAGARQILDAVKLPRRNATNFEFEGSRVLAIDDSPTHLEFLARELRGYGFVVTKAASGREGLTLLEEHEFDCVLVDLIMPGMDGIEVCRRINQTRQFHVDPVGIIMLTSQEGRDDMMRGIAAGADDFVGKSSDTAVLKARIQALLRRKFFEREHRRVVEALKSKELEAIRARAEKESAEVRARLAGELTVANQELENANRKLKAAQMHLVQSEKMASLGQLVAGIAHEINNPLTFVVNHLYTVENSLANTAREISASVSEATRVKFQKARTRLEEMREGVDRVKDLVSNLRTFSRLDEGEVKTIDIHENIDSVLRLLSYKLQGRIELERQYGAVPLVDCYAGQLNQVVMNLIANAIDAIEDRGKIVISTRAHNGQVMVSVRDTGSGIPEAIQNRIFDPFFTTKPVGRGTGLGLAISYQIVQAHGGAIEVRSRAGHGAEFTVCIPLKVKLAANEEETVSAG
jgi:two-component system NtrC family sensor kinase